jgi:hypothetical protein
MWRQLSSAKIKPASEDFEEAKRFVDGEISFTIFSGGVFERHHLNDIYGRHNMKNK